VKLWKVRVKIKEKKKKTNWHKKHEGIKAHAPPWKVSPDIMNQKTPMNIGFSRLKLLHARAS